MKPITIPLKIDFHEGILHGSVLINNNLIVDQAKSEEQLVIQMKTLIKNFEDVSDTKYILVKKFHLRYFFAKFEVLKPRYVARAAGMNESLLRQYVSGRKDPSEKQLKRIEDAIKEICLSLIEVKICK